MTKAKSQLLLLLLLIFYNTSLPAQVTTSTSAQWNRYFADSLIMILKTAKKNSIKVDLLHNLCFRLWWIQEYDKTIQYKNASLVLAKKLNLIKVKTRTYSYLSNIYEQMGKYSQVLQFSFWPHKILKL